MSISLPADLLFIVDEEVKKFGIRNRSEFIRHLIVAWMMMEAKKKKEDLRYVEVSSL